MGHGAVTDCVFCLIPLALLDLKQFLFFLLSSPLEQMKFSFSLFFSVPQAWIFRGDLSKWDMGAVTDYVFCLIPLALIDLK